MTIVYLYSGPNGEIVQADSKERVGRAVRNGHNIPQHRLLSNAEWNRLRKNEIRRLTYWATLGPKHDADGYTTYRHAFPVVVTKEDAPEAECAKV